MYFNFILPSKKSKILKPAVATNEATFKTFICFLINIECSNW